MMVVSVFVSCSSADTKSAQANTTVDYVALGDSIAAGYGLNETENSYVDLISKELDSKTINLAVNGMTSSQLLEKLESGEYDEVLRQADFISVSIGSNDLLKPFISRVSNALGISDPDDINREVIEDIKAKYKGNPILLFSLLGELNSSIINNEELYGFCDNFIFNNFPEILSYIRGINSSAQVVVNNIYNPYYGVSIYGVYDLGAIADSYINRINQAFVEDDDYTLVDLYEVFKNPGLTNSNIDFSEPDTLNFDPHPNKDGHMMIFSAVNSSLMPETSNSNMGNSGR
jgi:lysophospholipase L1-like esterase